MFRNSKFQMAAVIAAGTLIGYLAATGRLGLLAEAQEKDAQTPAPGSPDATTTIDGRYLPPPPQPFLCRIELNAMQ